MPIQSLADQPPANGGSTSTTAPSGITSSAERARPSTRNEDAATTADSSGRATKLMRSSCKVRAEDNSSGCPAARRAPAQNRTVTLTRSAAQPCSSGLAGGSLAAAWLSCWCPRSSICPSLSATDLILSEYLPPVTRSSAPEALTQAARLISRRGLIVLISDLLMEMPEVEAAMRALRAAGHDITVLHVMDPAERELPSSGEALFGDPESDFAVPASMADVRAAYKATVDEVIGEWRSMFGALGIGYEIVSTDAPFGVPLRRAFALRQLLP